MKAIIFYCVEHQGLLHLNEIKTTYTHAYQEYRQTNIYLLNNYSFEIMDPQKGDFLKLLEEFAWSDDIIKKMKIKDWDSYKDKCSFELVDWISAACK